MIRPRGCGCGATSKTERHSYSSVVFPRIAEVTSPVHLVAFSWFWNKASTSAFQLSSKAKERAMIEYLPAIGAGLLAVAIVGLDLFFRLKWRWEPPKRYLRYRKGW